MRRADDARRVVPGGQVSARAEIRPALERVIQLLRARQYPVSVALLRLLRDFGLECRDVGIMHAHTTQTIPAGGPLGDDEDTEPSPFAHGEPR